MALLLAAALSFTGIFGRGLWTPDEPREAEVGREMGLVGWSSMPTLGGEPFLEKPPLFPWVMAAGYALLGVSPGVARLPSALFALGAMLVAYGLGRRAGGRQAGILAAAVLGTSLTFLTTSHKALNDNALVFFVAAGHLALSVARDRHRRGAGFALLLALAGLAAALAFLTKGFVGPILVFAPPLVALLALRELAFLRRAVPGALLASGLAGLALALPWVLALGRTHGWDKVRTCLLDNTLGRSLGLPTQAGFSSGHVRGPFYYLATFPFAALPWSLALPALLAGKTLDRRWRAGRARFLALVAASGVLLLSFSVTKRELYLAPLLPAFAVVIGVWLSRVGTRRGGPLDRPTLIGIVALMGAIGLAGAWLGLGAPLPRSGEELRSSARAGWLAFGAACATLPLGALVWLGRLRRSRGGWGAAQATGLVLATFLVLLGALPLLDPAKDCRVGVEQLADQVPPDEPLVALDPDETTLAVIPFYSGRKLTALDTEAIAMHLDAGVLRHLLVQEKKRASLGDELDRRLRLERTIRLNATRTLLVLAALED